MADTEEDPEIYLSPQRVFPYVPLPFPYADLQAYADLSPIYATGPEPPAPDLPEKLDQL